MKTILAAALAVLICTSASAQTKAFVLLATPCPLGPCDPAYVLEVDVESRRALAVTRISNGPPAADRIGLSGDGRYLVWAGARDAMSRRFLSVFDTVTRTTIASVRVDVFGPPFGIVNPPQVAVHPSKPRVFLLDFESPHVVVIEPGRQQTFPVGCRGDLTGLSADGARLFVYCGTAIFPRPAGDTRVFDSETGELIGVVANASIPQAPNASGTELYAVGATGGLKRYDVATGAVLAEQTAGLAPGQTLLSVPVPLTTTTVSVPNVPPGVYYVRVRAANAAAVSAASDEVQVVVP